jgi:solute carrier family 25 aspartate/glutamate transporter 12/13
MADISKAKEAVKETLLGTDGTEEVKLSAQSKVTFEKNARKDADSGELFMAEEDFINAIAPLGEDYVSLLTPHRCTRTGPEPLADGVFSL